MAFHRYPITFAKLLIIAVLAYISLSGTGCNNIEGDKNMPFRDLDRNESLSTEIVNVKEYEAVGDGIKDDSSAITNAIAAASSSTLLLPAGTYRVGSNVIVPSDVTVWFTNGAKLSIDSGVTLTLNGKLDAGLSQIFSGDGTVSIAKGSVEYLVPQWWGAVGDGTNDDTAAIQAALTCAELKTKHVFLPPGIYKTTSALTLNYGTWLRGAGKSDITTIKVTGGGDGIDICRVITAPIYEGAKVSDLRIYSTTTPVTGVGIKIAADRSVDIENVWVGSWYPASSTYGYGFDKGIEIITQPAYHTCIRRAYIFRCNYGVYINGGCNEARVLDGEIWYCDYGVYVGQVQTVRIINNSIEQFVTAGVYVDCTEPIVMNNRFEGVAGSQPVILGTHCDRSHIENCTNVTGMGNSNSVLNNSTYEYQRINESKYPIGNHNVGTGLAGLISSDFYNYAAKDVTIESIPGDLKLKARAIGKSIELQSVAECDSHFITPNGGFGDQVANYFLFSEAFSMANWYDWGTGSKTVTDNAAVSPNGTLTASKIVVSASNGIFAYSSDPLHSAGDVYVFSIWIRSDIAHHGILYLRRDSTTIHSLDVAIGTEWKRFTISAILNASATNVTAIIVPGALYPTYLWSAQITKGTSITGTDNSGVDNKTTKLIDTTKNFIASGVDIGGMAEVATGAGIAMGKVTSVNSTISFDTGTGTQPAVGTTITGGTSTATGTVVEVAITSGTFVGGDAAGYIEINTIMGTFQAETITWIGGSVNATAYYLNDVLVFSGGLQIGYGSKVDVDNGDTYYTCSSKAIAPKPYVKTTGSAVVGSTTPALSATSVCATGTISAQQGFVRKVDVVNPLNSHRTIYPGTEIAVYNPGAALNITLSTTGVLAGHICEVVNISSTYSLWMIGPQISLAPGETGRFLYTGSAWTVVWIGQSYLQKSSGVSFKAVNGAAYALTYASTITCYMTNGNVFTLTTTGDCTINVHNTYTGTAGQMATFIITDDGTGGHVVTFGTKFKPSGTLTGTANKTATVTFAFDGSNWYEVSRTTGL
jgi:hypothetical protein